MEITQTDFCKIVGISRGTYTNWMNQGGVTYENWQLIGHVANKFGAKPEVVKDWFYDDPLYEFGDEDANRDAGKSDKESDLIDIIKRQQTQIEKQQEQIDHFAELMKNLKLLEEILPQLDQIKDKS